MKTFIPILTALFVMFCLPVFAKHVSADSSTVMSLIDSTASYYIGKLEFIDSNRVNTNVKWLLEDKLKKERLLESKEIWVRLSLPKKQFDKPAILLIGYYNKLEVFIDGTLIFYKDFLGNENYINYNKKIISFDKNQKNEFLFLRIQRNSWYASGGFDKIIAGESNDLLDEATETDLAEINNLSLNVSVGAILVIISILSFIFFFKRRSKYKYYPFISFSVISLLSGIDNFIETSLILILPVHIMVYFYFQLIYVIAVPVAFSIFIKQIFGDGWKSVFKNFWKFHTPVMFTYSIIFVVDFNYLFNLPDLGLLIILEILFFSFVFFKSGFHKQKNSKYIFFAILIFFLFGLIDLLGPMVFEQWTLDLYGIGLILMSVSLINLLMNTYSEKTAEVESYEAKVRENELELINLKKENLQSQYDALKAQINPHFLFNTFSTLMNLIRENQEHAVQFVQKLSNVYRYVLQSKDNELILLEDEINFIYAYIFLLKKRFGGGFIHSINIPREYMLYSIVPLSLQILIENCIKHNIISDKKPLTVEVFIDNENKLIVVKNNLQLKSVFEESTKIGLQNIKNRYMLLTNKDIFINQTEKFFEVKIPLIKNTTENGNNNN